MFRMLRPYPIDAVYGLELELFAYCADHYYLELFFFCIIQHTVILHTGLSLVEL